MNRNRPWEKPWYDARSMEHNPHVTLSHGRNNLDGGSLEEAVNRSSGSGFLNRSLRVAAPIALAAYMALMTIACGARATPVPTLTPYERTIQRLSMLLDETLADTFNESSHVRNLSQTEKELLASGIYSARYYGSNNTAKNEALQKILTEGSFELRQIQFYQKPGHVLLLYHPDRKEDAEFMFSFAEVMLPLVEKYAATSLKRDPFVLYIGPLTTASPVGLLAGPDMLAVNQIYHYQPTGRFFIQKNILHEVAIFNMGVGKASPKLQWLDEGGSEFLAAQILEEILRTSTEWHNLIPVPGATEEERSHYTLTVEERFGHGPEIEAKRQEFLAAMEKATDLVYVAKDGTRYVVLARLPEESQKISTELINFLISWNPLLSKGDKGALQAGRAEIEGSLFWYDLSNLTGNPTILTDVLRAMPPAQNFKPGQFPEYMKRPQNELLKDYVLKAVPESQRAEVEAFYNLRVFGIEN